MVTIPILSLRPGESPRLRGEDKRHVARLAETDSPLPPILVDRRTMRVIDGMHRLMAASMRGQDTIDVEFFDGDPEDAFLQAVRANVTHGFPLSQADRRAAAIRIVATHPRLSDRAIAEVTGLGARTVASIRRSSGPAPEAATRIGRDGKVRPLDSGEGRRRTAEFIAMNPNASLREVARGAGVSPGTARAVRQRLERGEEPVLPQPRRSGTTAKAGKEAGPAEPADGEPGTAAGAGVDEGAAEPPVTEHEAALFALDKLVRDPSLRHNEQGRRLLRLLQHTAAEAKDWLGAAEAVPPHCLATITSVARHFSAMWLSFAEELDDRAVIADPWGDRPADVTK
ncbi:ParB/RepB/Spo0J family partition protein [Amycolatopsis balhimycina]|uniref:ParB/RepB/Spo0J family partition protein n=1 Tax=Amycolatopsis balhimycina TaxID=208443 RepID=UPI0003735FB2